LFLWQKVKKNHSAGRKKQSNSSPTGAPYQDHHPNGLYRILVTTQGGPHVKKQKKKSQSMTEKKNRTHRLPARGRIERPVKNERAMGPRPDKRMAQKGKGKREKSKYSPTFEEEKGQEQNGNKNTPKCVSNTQLNVGRCPKRNYSPLGKARVQWGGKDQRKDPKGGPGELKEHREVTPINQRKMKSKGPILH